MGEQMAEVRKKNIGKKNNTEKTKNKNKNTVKKREEIKKSESKDKKSIFVRFRVFCHGVKSEFDKVHWPSKDDMVKYSISTIIFVIFCATFFYFIDSIFAFIRTLF